MANIAGPRRLINYGTANALGDPIDAYSVPLAYIQRSTVCVARVHRQDIRSHHIPYVSKVPRIIAVAVNSEWRAGCARPQESADDCNVRALGGHARAKDVEIAQGQRLHAVKTMEQPRILLARELLQCVGTERVRAHCLL